jgi:hypothetical protein
MFGRHGGGRITEKRKKELYPNLMPSLRATLLSIKLYNQGEIWYNSPVERRGNVAQVLTLIALQHIVETTTHHIADRKHLSEALKCETHC